MAKKRLVKIALWGLGACVALFAFFIFLGLFGYPIQNYLILKNQESMIAAGQRRAAKVLEIQKADNYGGKTPEETLDLYIKALKAGDIELASKYYEISVENMELQKDKLEQLRLDSTENLIEVSIKNLLKIKELGVKNVFSNGNTSIVYSYMTTAVSTTTMSASGQEILVVKPAGIPEEIGKVFRKNPYTKVWKIIQ